MRRLFCIAAATAVVFVAAPGLARAPAAAQVAHATLPRVLELVDHSRLIRLPSGRTAPRPVTTYLWYPRETKPWPLVVFGHGFATTPATYVRLLKAWADAGYLVAAPLFPLGNAHAPGGPTESDLINQPRDMRFVISRLIAASRGGESPLDGAIDTRRIAVAGQSDGAVTAFATAYERHWQDSRIDAALILSGAELGGSSEPLGVRQPPLLAVQGSADSTNAPANTYALFHAVRGPKFLLVLHGAGHLPPYTLPGRALGAVQRVTTAFLDHYLRGNPLSDLLRAPGTDGYATLTSGR